MNRWILFSLSLLFIACTSLPHENDPIIRVDERVVVLREYLNLFENLKPKDVELQGDEKTKIKNLVLQTLVRRAVILNAAEKQNINISSEELQKGLLRFKSGYPDQVFNETLLEGMLEEEDWKELIRENLLIDRLFQASNPKLEAPSLEEALAYYEGNPHQYTRPSEVTAEHIVVNDRDLAEEIRKNLNAKPSLFLSLARENSIGPEAKDDARIRVEKGILPDKLDEILFSIPLKKLSPIISTDYGYHLVRVVERKPEVNLDFNQVKQEIFEHLYEEKRKAWMEKFEDQLIRSASIEYNRKLIKGL